MITVVLPGGGEIDVETDDPQAASRAAKAFLSKESPTARGLRVAGAAEAEGGPSLISAVPAAVPFADEVSALGAAVGAGTRALGSQAVQAVGGALGADVSGFGTENPFTAAREAFNIRARQVRERQKAGREEFGVLPDVIAGVGSVATRPLAAAATAIGAGQTATPGLTGVLQRAGARTVQGARGGVIGGGIGGVAEGEGLVGRLFSGLGGALIGGGLGASLGVAAPAIERGIGALFSGSQRAGQAAGSAARGISQAVPRFGDIRRRRIERVLERGGTTPEAALARIERGQAQGTPLGIADVVGDAGRRELRGAVQFPGRASQLATETLERRMMSLSGRTQQRLGTMLGVPNRDFRRTQQQIIQERAAAAGPAFRAAKDQQQPFDVSPSIIALDESIQQARGRVQRQLLQVRNLFTDEIKFPNGQKVRVPVRTLEQYQSARQSLDEMLGRVKSDPTSVGSIVRGELGAFRDDINRTVRETNSLFAQADDAFSGSKRMENALEEGRKFIRDDAEVTADVVQAMTPGEKEMFRIGVMRELRKDLGRKRPLNDVTLKLQTPNFQGSLRNAFPQTSRGQADFQRFMDSVRDEVETVSTVNTVLRNSSTAGKQQDAIDFAMFDRLGNAARSGNITDAVQQGMMSAIRRSVALREKDAENIVRALLDPAQGRQILQQMVKTGGRRTAQDILRASRAASRYARDTFGPALISGEVIGGRQAQ